MPAFDAQPTPNPDSLKITRAAGPFIDDGLRAFASAEEARGDALGEQLFSVTGVDNVFITPQFVTVTKAKGAAWERLLPKIKHVLGDFYAEE